ncbi:MAG TPA: nitroreductase family protein [Steroidobacteraceae bacterium]|nr:nitroreductase family protein [Steroidobacteraceae bacterium]
MSPAPPEMSAPQPIALPPPGVERDLPVCAALAQRKTTRRISAAPLPLQVLSNLLWAAWGINRPVGASGLPGRTAASASNSQELDLYVALREATWLYDAAGHLLRPVVAADLRAGALTPGQRGIEASAPVQLIFVADLDRLTYSRGYQEPGLQDPDVQMSYAYVATGLIAGNVYVFAAAQELATWFHNCDKPGLALRLQLGPTQRVLFAQSVGYPEPEP